MKAPLFFAGTVLVGALALAGCDQSRDADPVSAASTPVERSAAFLPGGTIGDFVWHDLNCNGIQDDGEPGLAGVQLKLYDAVNGNLVRTTTSSATGSYLFADLIFWDYRVVVVTPAGFRPTTPGQGGDITRDSNTDSCEVKVEETNPTDLTIDFGFCTDTPPAGTEGCTPGYWKNHLGSWAPTGYTPDQDFDTVFGTDYFTPNITLREALRRQGGGVNRGARHGTAALLSAAHGDVDYPFTVAQVIAAVRAGMFDDLERANELGCPLAGRRIAE